MSKIDKIISEKCSKDILKSFNSCQEPNKIDLQNLFISITYMIKDGDTPGKHFRSLKQYLDSKFSQMDESKKPGFDIGAIFGSLKILDEFYKAEKG